MERHYTDSMSRKGPDIINSMDPLAARELVEGSKIIKEERGGVKGPVPEEKSVIDFAFSSVVSISERAKMYARRSVVSLKPIKAGEVFTSDNIGCKRPGTGISPKMFDKILGTPATRDVPTDTHISFKDVEIR